MVEGCPYCGNTGFLSHLTYTPDGHLPQDVARWLNCCAACSKWSVWLPDGGQVALPNPEDPESLE